MNDAQPAEAQPTERSEEEQYVAYCESLQFSLATLLNPHHQGVVLEVAMRYVLAQTHAMCQATGSLSSLEDLERGIISVRKDLEAGNAEAAAE